MTFPCNGFALALVVFAVTNLTACDQFQVQSTQTAALPGLLASIAAADDACQILTSNRVEQVLGQQVNEVSRLTPRQFSPPKPGGKDRWCTYSLDKGEVGVSIIQDQDSKKVIVDDIAFLRECGLRPDNVYVPATPTPLPAILLPLLSKSFKELWLMKWSLEQKCYALERVEEWKEVGAFTSLLIRTGTVTFPMDQFIFSISFSVDKDIAALTSGDKDSIIKNSKDLARLALAK